MEDVVTVIDSIGYDLQNMRDKKGILDVDKESEKYFQSLMVHEANKRELNLRVKSYVSLKEYIISAKDENILPPSLYINDEDQYLSSSINDFYQLQLKSIELNHGFKKGTKNLTKYNYK